MIRLAQAVPIAEQASGGTAEAVAFWICGGLAVVGALGLVFSRKAVHSALFVAMAMINLAVLYAVNQAPFLGLVQVIVYTGAVMMLFLFVLMIVGVGSADSLVETLAGQRWVTGLLLLGFGVLIISGITQALDGFGFAGLSEANAEFGGNVQGLARLIFDEYLLAFQVVAALLITAALGALVLAHRERVTPRRSQRVLSEERFRSGEHPGPLPNPGVLTTSNAVGTAALLPDGSPAIESIPIPLRSQSLSTADESAEASRLDPADRAAITEGQDASALPADGQEHDDGGQVTD